MFKTLIGAMLLFATSEAAALVGCSSTAVEEIEVVFNAIYACSGSFSGGGTWGAEAGRLCAAGYSVCRSAIRAAELGMTQALCDNADIFDNPAQFFGSAETSTGWLKCYSEQDPSGGSAYTGELHNDIWGCANPNQPPVSGRLYVSPGADCQAGVGGPVIFDRAIGNGDVLTHWKYSQVAPDYHWQEARKYALESADAGGVLCCLDDDYCDERTDQQDCLTDDDCNIAGSDCMVCCKTGVCHNRDQLPASPAKEVGGSILDLPQQELPKSIVNNKDNWNGYYDVMMGGFILFILINNIFICYWCVCKDGSKGFYHNVKVNEYNEE